MPHLIRQALTLSDEDNIFEHKIVGQFSCLGDAKSKIMTISRAKKMSPEPASFAFLRSCTVRSATAKARISNVVN